MKEGKNNTVLLTVIGIATLLVAVVGATFAYFSAQLSGTESQSTMVIQATNGGSSTLDGGDAITVENIYPKDEAWVNKKLVVSYDNQSAAAGTKYKYNVGLHYTNGFETNDIQYTITEGWCEGSAAATSQSTCAAANGTWYSNSTEKGTITKTQTTKAAIPVGTGDLDAIASAEINLPCENTKQYYTLRIYFVNDASRNQVQGAEFTGFVTSTEVNG